MSNCGGNASSLCTGKASAVVSGHPSGPTVARRGLNGSVKSVRSQNATASPSVPLVNKGLDTADDLYTSPSPVTLSNPVFFRNAVNILKPVSERNTLTVDR